ncbi:MAG: hypothetical protein AAB532_00435 [Patescibacteria group bacterium]
MKYEVDQSAKTEQTNKDTIISIANKDLFYTLKINSKIKQSLQKYFNKIKKPKLFAVYVFTSGLILLIKQTKLKNTTVIIDLEYYGYNSLIHRELNKHLNQNLEFRFSSIGKKSPAHDSAYKVFKKKVKPNYLVNRLELEKLVLQMLKM